MDRAHPLDAKRSCDAVAHALKVVEDNIRNMFSDVQALKDGRYHQAEQMYRRVYRLHQRWASLQARLQSELLINLSAKGQLHDGVTVTRETNVTTEVRLLETNDAYRRVQDCLDWIQNKQIEIENTGYGNDLESSKDAFDFHRVVHHEIQDFSKEVDRCKLDRRSLTSEEEKVYEEHLTKLEMAYSQLAHASNHRLRSLESLLDFMSMATQELIWLNDKEEVEISRDWSTKGLQIQEIEEYYESVMSDLESRESQFNSVQDKGEALVMGRHPAAKTIEAYMAAMQTQWSWLLQLTMCLETHLKHASHYYKFYNEADDADRWILRQTELLNTHYNRKQVVLDAGEKLIREIQELKENLVAYEDITDSLVGRSIELTPLKQRGQRQSSPRTLLALCSYKQLQMSITKDEECVLLDNSQKVKWRVRNSRGQEGQVPAVCFLVPPPDREAIAYAESLQQRLSGLKTLWSQRQRQLKKLMIFATISVIKSDRKSVV